jgi:hypothetical protein
VGDTTEVSYVVYRPLAGEINDKPLSSSPLATRNSGEVPRKILGEEFQPLLFGYVDLFVAEGGRLLTTKSKYARTEATKFRETAMEQCHEGVDDKCAEILETLETMEEDELITFFNQLCKAHATHAKATEGGSDMAAQVSAITENQALMSSLKDLHHRFTEERPRRTSGPGDRMMPERFRQFVLSELTAPSAVEGLPEELAEMERHPLQDVLPTMADSVLKGLYDALDAADSSGKQSIRLLRCHFLPFSLFI